MLIYAKYILDASLCRLDFSSTRQPRLKRLLYYSVAGTCIGNKTQAKTWKQLCHSSNLSDISSNWKEQIPKIADLHALLASLARLVAVMA